MVQGQKSCWSPILRKEGRGEDLAPGGRVHLVWKNRLRTEAAGVVVLLVGSCGIFFVS